MQKINYVKSIKILFEELKILKGRLNQIDRQISMLKLEDGLKGVSYEKDKIQTSQSDGMDFIIQVLSDIEELEKEQQKIKYVTDLVQTALTQLEPTEYKIIELRFIKNKSNIEISMELNISERSLNRSINFTAKKLHTLIFGLTSNDFDGFNLFTLIEKNKIAN